MALYKCTANHKSFLQPTELKKSWQPSQNMMQNEKEITIVPNTNSKKKSSKRQKRTEERNKLEEELKSKEIKNDMLENENRKQDTEIQKLLKQLKDEKSQLIKL